MAFILRQKKKRPKVDNMTKYRPQSNPKKEAKRKEFLRLGGGLSGVYDISDTEIRTFVRDYKEFIPKKIIYKRNKKGSLVPAFRRRKNAKRK